MQITTSPFVRTYTLDDFWELPDPADRSKLELIRGVLYMTPPPDEFVHDPVVSQLNLLLTAELIRLGHPGRLYVPRSGIWTYYPDTWLEPDLFYLSNESVARFRDRPRTSADLVIEVLSPATALYDRTTKADTYAALGVREFWLVDPQARQIEVRTGDGRRWTGSAVYGRGGRIVSAVLPELELPLDAVFEVLAS